VKFVVVDGATGNRSSTWCAWTGKHVDDVYLLEVTTGPMWKVSHHNDGKVWRLAMTQEGATQLGVERPVIDHWVPSEPQEGWGEGVGVLVPCAYLRPATDPIPTSTVQIPTSPDHSAMWVRLLFEEPGAPELKSQPSYPVAALARCNGGTAWVIGQPEALGFEQHETLAAMCSEARTAMTNDQGQAAERLLVDLAVS
jgi:hypothetical protein